MDTSISTHEEVARAAAGEGTSDIEYFHPKWFDKLGLKTIILNLAEGSRNFDYDIIPALKAAMKEKYDYDKKILVTMSDIDELRGHTVNGKHRLVGMDENLDEGVALPNPFPVDYVDVKSMSEVIALQIHYDEEHLRDVRKSPKIIKEGVKQKVQELIEVQRRENPTVPLTKWIEGYKVLNDFDKDKIFDLMEYFEKQAKLQLEAQKLGQSRSRQDWGEVTTQDTSKLDPDIERSGSVNIKCAFCHEEFSLIIHQMKNGKMMVNILAVPSAGSASQEILLKLKAPKQALAPVVK